MSRKQYELSRPDERIAEKGSDMKKEMVRHTLVKRSLTHAALEKRKALALRPDSEIDTSDMPAWTDEQWKTAVRGRFYRPVKQQVTLRVDADILHWLKREGKGYQSRLNAILRRQMMTEAKR
jgi:uncharacterized protein (DUF4415 family)